MLPRRALPAGRLVTQNMAALLTGGTSGRNGCDHSGHGHGHDLLRLARTGRQKMLAVPLISRVVAPEYDTVSSFLAES